MSVDYSAYGALKFNRPEPGIVEVILSNPGKLNSLDEDGHRELSEVWRDIDKDDETSAVLLLGDGCLPQAHQRRAGRHTAHRTCSQQLVADGRPNV